MSALSLFTDNIFHIGPVKDIFVRGKQTSVKYTDNKKYAARVLALCKDEKILMDLKLNLEETTDCIEGDWMCLTSSDMSYAQASKLITQNSDNGFIFMDKAILPKTNEKECIFTLRRDFVDDQGEFFVNPSRFLKLTSKAPTTENPPPVHGTSPPPVNHQDRKRETAASSGAIPLTDTAQVDLRATWTTEDRVTVLRAFQKDLEAGRIPSGAEMQELIYKNSCLEGRTVPQLRSWLHTQKKKLFKDNKACKKRGKKVAEISSIPDVDQGNSSCATDSSNDAYDHRNASHNKLLTTMEIPKTSQTSNLELQKPEILDAKTSGTGIDSSHGKLEVKTKASQENKLSTAQLENPKPPTPEIMELKTSISEPMDPPELSQLDVPPSRNLSSPTNAINEDNYTDIVSKISHPDDSKKIVSTLSPTVLLTLNDNYDDVSEGKPEGGLEKKSSTDPIENSESQQPDIVDLKAILPEQVTPQTSDSEVADLRIFTLSLGASSPCHTSDNTKNTEINRETTHPDISGKNISTLEQIYPTLEAPESNGSDAGKSKVESAEKKPEEQLSTTEVVNSKIPVTGMMDLETASTDTIYPATSSPTRFSGNNDVVSMTTLEINGENESTIVQCPMPVDGSGVSPNHNDLNQTAAYPIERTRVEEECGLDETQGTKIFTPSASLDSSESEPPIATHIYTMPMVSKASGEQEEILKTQKTTAQDDDSELSPNDDFFTTQGPFTVSMLDNLLLNLESAATQEPPSNIDPFKYNVFADEASVSQGHVPQHLDTLQTDKIGNSTTKQRPKIIHEEVIKMPLNKFYAEKKMQRKGAKRRLSFETEPPNYKDNSSTDNSESETPLLHSTMNESQISHGDKMENEAEVAGYDENAEESDNSEKHDGNYEPEGEESSDDDDDYEDLGLDQDDVVEEAARNEPGGTEPLNITLGDDPRVSAPDDRELRVDMASAGAKKHFCCFCKKLQSKLARHLEFVHSNEEDVKKFVALPPRNKERQEIIATLRKNGDYLFNTDRRFNTGQLIVTRRPNARMLKTAEDFHVCGNCKGQYAKSVIRHHFRRCAKRSGKYERVVLVSGRKIACRVHEKASDEVRKYLYPYFHEDEVVRSIRYDELLTVYANKQCQKYGTHQHLYAMIRARLRLLGRFLIEIKKIQNLITNFSEIYNPRFYDSAIQAVRIVAGYMPDQRIFRTPAVASNLGTLMKHVGEILRSECIKKELSVEQKRVEDFLKLLAEDFGTSINRMVAETQTQNNRRKEVILPSTDDIKKLHTLIKTDRCRYYSKLCEKFSFDDWNNLGKMTLLSLQIFNRRRPGEIERLYLDDFNSHRGLDYTADKEAYNGLSEEGKKLAKKYVRFEIRGKLNRGVPVLVDNETLDCLKLLIKYRQEAGVPTSNTYLFGLPSSDKHRQRYHRACDLMREYSTKCGAAIPSALRGTKLRKHIATRCINLNLTDGQVTDLANFMGHHEKIHKDIYRQPVLETDIVKISKILNTAQGFDMSDDSDDGDETGPSTSGMDFSTVDTDKEPSTSKRRSSGKFNKSFGQSGLDNSQPRRWGEKERDIVLTTFKNQLTAGKIPSGKDMQGLIDSSPHLRGRTVPQLRSWLHTQKKKMSKG